MEIFSFVLYIGLVCFEDCGIGFLLGIDFYYQASHLVYLFTIKHITYPFPPYPFPLGSPSYTSQINSVV